MKTFLTRMNDSLLHLNSLGVKCIHYLQQRYNNLDELFLFACYMWDPRHAYVIYFPLVFYFSHSIGIKVLWAATLSEWLNLALKWLLQEDRPYWWVSEDSDGRELNLTLRQFPITCETGPGSPSGHVMVTTCVLFQIIKALTEKQGILVKVGGWSIYAVVILLVGIARVFIAAHFPHQCLLGFIVGIGLGAAINSLEVTRLTFWHHCLVSCLLFAITMGHYKAMQIIGYNPNHALSLALKWCEKQEYVHVDTTPLYCSMRYVGSLVGLGAALVLGKKYKLVPVIDVRHYILKLVTAFISIFLTRVMFSMVLPEEVIYLYIIAFIHYFLFPFLVVVYVPLCLKLCISRFS
ncbi:glucose-6-phosphatase 3-like isoform X2 [Tachypleus tridentatus]|uniref:glucose-6-phosphatase 3-like isoform X2 n=1 Tax=Tachypleus tridentatus TaxID=6853 RepID=UPI003FD3554C